MSHVSHVSIYIPQAVRSAITCRHLVVIVCRKARRKPEMCRPYETSFFMFKELFLLIFGNSWKPYIQFLSSLGCGSWTELCVIMHVFVFRMLVSKFAKNLVVSEFLFSWKWTSRGEASSFGTWLSKKLDIGLTFWYSSPVQPCHVVCFVQIAHTCTCGWTWNLRCWRQNTNPPEKNPMSQAKGRLRKKNQDEKTWYVTCGKLLVSSCFQCVSSADAFLNKSSVSWTVWHAGVGFRCRRFQSDWNYQVSQSQETKTYNHGEFVG